MTDQRRTVDGLAGESVGRPERGAEVEAAGGRGTKSGEPPVLVPFGGTAQVGDGALQESEERFRAVFESSAIGIAVCDTAGRFVQTNATFQEMVGYSSDELNGMTFQEITHPQDGEEGLRKLPELSEGRRNRVWIEKRYCRKDGRLLWGRAAISSVHDLDGKVKYQIALVEDITECQSAMERAGFQAQLLDSVRESVMATDLGGRLLYWGKGAERLYGYTAEEVIGKPVSSIIVEPGEEDQEEERMREVRETGSWSGQYVQRRKDGSRFLSDTTISLFLD